MKKILITGGNGFIGRKLIIELKNKGYEIYCLIREKTDTRFFIKNKILFFIYKNEKDLEIFFSTNIIDSIIHLATLYLVNNNLKDIDDLIDSNITLGTKLLEIGSKYGVKDFLNTSTFIQNYENKNYSPNNLYAATKQAFEDIGRYYAEANKINFISLSLVNSYGKGDLRKKIFNIWKESIDNKVVIKSTSGEQFIDILYIDDVIDAYIKLLHFINNKNNNNIVYEKYAISSGNIIKLKELAIIFEEVLGKKINIKWGALEHRDREIMFPYNIGKKIPNWKPKIDFEKGIKLFLDINT